MLKLHVLASGSKGNAAIVENAATGAGVLIDCGICKRDFLERCDEAGFDPTRLEAVFITHEHGDHTKGLGVVLRGLAKLGCAPMVYANRACVDNSSTLQKIAGDSKRRRLAQHLRFPKTKMRARAAIRLSPAMSASCAPPACA